MDQRHPNIYRGKSGLPGFLSGFHVKMHPITKEFKRIIELLLFLHFFSQSEYYSDET